MRKETLVDVLGLEGMYKNNNDSELVPSSLASIVPILRVANRIETKDPRVAYICRFHAFEKARNLDPTSSGRGVRQFKTYLLYRLGKLKNDQFDTRSIFAKNDPREIQKFYQWYYENYVKDGPVKRKPEEMADYYQTASVLYDVLKLVMPSERIDDEMKRYAREVERKKHHFAHYNILPLHASGVASAIMEHPEIKAAINALRKVDNLPRPRVQSTASMKHNARGSTPDDGDGDGDGDESISDLLDWLRLAFGFQKGNVENQREHLILLLANVDIRHKGHEEYSLLDNDTVRYLMDKVFKNYRSWCFYLHREVNLKFPCDIERQQLGLLYLGLYFLVWGEASNIRFMPECLCYIFHNMANELHSILVGNVHVVSGVYFEPAYQGEESFLSEVVTPIYQVMRKEVLRNKDGAASHSRWRNYDDLNEYFWSNDCFKLGWPMDRQSDFFLHSKKMHPKTEHCEQVITGRKMLKANFVEVRTFWHLFRSFDRMWIFFAMVFQAMLIIAWSPSGSLIAFFDPDVFENILSIFITSAIFNLFQAVLNIILSWKAWGSMQYNQILRYLLKFSVAVAWMILLPLCYSGTVQDPTGLTKFFGYQSLYKSAVVIYMLPNILSAFLFMLPSLQRTIELSNWRIVIVLMWWAQPDMYVGKGMHEDMFSLLRYTLFWILLLVVKLAFNYYVEINPLVELTKMIIDIRAGSYEWHEFIPYMKHNIGIFVTIWAPIILVYFMDTQIWYAIFSTILGGIRGAFSHLHEFPTLEMLKSRFESVPSAFTKHLVTFSKEESTGNQAETQRKNIDKFSCVWNAFISSLRDEDLISNREKDLLLVPYSTRDISVVQWPSFLLASKIPIALSMAKDFEGKDDEELMRKMKNDNFMFTAIIECYQTIRSILCSLFSNEDDTKIIRSIFESVDSSLVQRKFLNNFRMSELPQLSNKLEKLLNLLKGDHEDIESSMAQIINVLQGMMEMITQDVIINENGIFEAHASENDDTRPKFTNLNFELMYNKPWMDKVVRLHLLLTVKESAMNVPINLDARRRITFFANSLFMNMPTAPKVRNMLSFSVLTPYYKEDVLYSEDELNKENEDGISILFYLQTIYPDEWRNFLERIKYDPKDKNSLEEKIDLVRHWVSYRGQTLSRTVRGMMYYRQALELQCFLDTAEDQAMRGGLTIKLLKNYDNQKYFAARLQAIADMKFTYVVSCQFYGMLKKSTQARDRSCYQNILNLMLLYPSLRVAYIDEHEEPVNGKMEKCYYSVLVKGGDQLDEEIYRIKLPGKPTDIGEGKSGNQNHAIIFTRGEALQTIDMNQDGYLEEAFKMRNVLEEFQRDSHGQHQPTILGLREHIFTGSVSSLAWFMSNQEMSFVTIVQRILANPLKVQFNYGHPDVFDRIFHLTRGGISKASKIINLSEAIFAGFNSTLRSGSATHPEYMQVGKGHDVGMNQISLFEAKVSNGNGEQTLSRDVYRLGHGFDFYRMLSFYFTTVGFYFSSLVTVLTVYVFLYGRLYLVISGLERSILEDPRIQKRSMALDSALASQCVFQLGLLLVLPMVMEVGLEKGLRAAMGEFVFMQLQLAAVFFTFQLGTKAHHYGRTILHGGGAKHRDARRGLVYVVVSHARFADNYRMYSRSHFVKGLELMMLLVVYEVYGRSLLASSTPPHLLVTFSMWFLVASWLFAPFIFNPSGFEWQKTVDDWTDWSKWMGNRGGIGISNDRSWESWWKDEHQHLRHTSFRGRVLEVMLALRFLVYQYGIVYHLNIACHSRRVLVYGLSWLAMLTVLVVLKIVSMGTRRLSTNSQLMFRILKGLLFLGFVAVVMVLFVVYGLTISDVFAALLGLLPTGWSLLLVGQVCTSPLERLGFWDSFKELGRAYEYVMGFVIFTPVAALSWFPFVSDFQTRLLFSQAFSRGLQISRILAGRKKESWRLHQSRPLQGFLN